jgi:hypothetical protein
LEIGERGFDGASRYTDELSRVLGRVHELDGCSQARLAALESEGEMLFVIHPGLRADAALALGYYRSSFQDFEATTLLGRDYYALGPVPAFGDRAC